MYVDQWDWEKVIREEDRTLATLRDTMERIITAICITLDRIKWEYPQVKTVLERNVSFVTTQELEDLYPDKTHITRLFYYKTPVKKAFGRLILPIAMKKHRGIVPSMLQDLKKGMPCEIDAINGVVCREGRKYSVPTPVNDRIVDTVKKIQAGQLKPEPKNIELFRDLI